MDSYDECCSSRSGTPVSTIDVENDHYSDDEQSYHSNDSCITSREREETKSESGDIEDNRPKLSFGISAILSDVIHPRSKSPSARSLDFTSQNNIPNNYQRLFSPFPDGTDEQLFAGYSMIGSDGRPLIPTASPPLGIVHQARLSDIEYARRPGGFIKVPEHRPPFAHLEFNPLMFPWMQERKERLAGKKITNLYIIV